MAKDQTVPIQAPVLQADEDAFVALKASSSYRHRRQPQLKHRCAQRRKPNCIRRMPCPPRATLPAQWEYHNIVLGAKSQLLAQYGPDSDELPALDFKKNVERKAPTRASKPA